MIKTKMTLVACMGVVLTACGNPLDPSEKNFKNAVQTYLDHKFPVCVVSEEKFPTEPITLDFGNKKTIYSDLVSKGIMTVQEVSVPGYFKNSAPRIGHTFDLTPEGRKYLVSNTDSKRAKQGLCVGKGKVEVIDNFTQPAAMFGQTISEVRYSYTVTDLPEWTKTPSLLASAYEFSKMVNANGQPVEGKATLVLTGKGWMEYRMFNKSGK